MGILYLDFICRKHLSIKRVNIPTHAFNCEIMHFAHIRLHDRNRKIKQIGQNLEFRAFFGE